MSDHLPECPWADRGYAFPCICDRLRACEQRALDTALDAVRTVECPECSVDAALAAIKDLQP